MTETTTDLAMPKVRSHYSALTLHRKCPQAHYYKYDLRLDEPKGRIAPERDFGSWWSVLRAAEAVERGKKLGSLKQDLETELKFPDDSKTTIGALTVDAVFEAVEQWWKVQKNITDPEGIQASEIWQERLGGEAPQLLRNLLQRHLTQWADQIAYEEPLGVEVFWERYLPIPKNDPWVDEYPEMKLIGYVDEIFRDTKRNLIVARDHKTSKKMDPSSSVDDMMDSQLQLYAWGANPLVQEWTGEGIKAVAYDRAKSVAPRPPSLTNSGRLRQHKGEPTVGMMDLQTYLDWCASGPEYPGTKKDGSGAGIYELEENVVEKLKTPGAASSWFQRSQMPLNRNIVTTHVRAAVDSSLDVYRTEQRTKLTAEAQRNLTRNCSWCSYAKLCRAQMVGGVKGEYELAEYDLISKDGQTVLDKGILH